MEAVPSSRHSSWRGQLDDENLWAAQGFLAEWEGLNGNVTGARGWRAGRMLRPLFRMMESSFRYEIR